MINNDTAPRPINRDELLAIIDAAYAPEDCEACEIEETTCEECIADALDERGIILA